MYSFLSKRLFVCVVFFLGIYIPVDPFCYKHHFVLPTNAALLHSFGQKQKILLKLTRIDIVIDVNCR